MYNNIFFSQAVPNFGPGDKSKDVAPDAAFSAAEAVLDAAALVSMNHDLQVHASAVGVCRVSAASLHPLALAPSPPLPTACVRRLPRS